MLIVCLAKIKYRVGVKLLAPLRRLMEPCVLRFPVLHRLVDHDRRGSHVSDPGSDEPRVPHVRRLLHHRVLHVSEGHGDGKGTITFLLPAVSHGAGLTWFMTWTLHLLETPVFAECWFHDGCDVVVHEEAERSFSFGRDHLTDLTTCTNTGNTTEKEGSTGDYR